MSKLKNLQENIKLMKANLEELENGLEHPKIYLVCRLAGKPKFTKVKGGCTRCEGLLLGVFVKSAHFDLTGATDEKIFWEKARNRNGAEYIILDVEIDRK
jgi:hypothetical protein